MIQATIVLFVSESRLAAKSIEEGLEELAAGVRRLEEFVPCVVGWVRLQFEEHDGIRGVPGMLQAPGEKPFQWR